MNRFGLSLNLEAVKNAVRQWPMSRRIQLVRELEEETWAGRVMETVRRIRRQAGSLSQKEVNRIVMKVRKRIYGKDPGGY